MKCMKVEVFYFKSDMHVRPQMRFSILCTSTDSSDKTRLMYSTILLCLFVSKYDINGSRLNYSTVTSNKFKNINMYCNSFSKPKRISVARKTPLQIRIRTYKTSLLHWPDDYIGFTPCCPPHFTTKLRPCTIHCIHYIKVFKENILYPVWTGRDPKNLRLSVQIFPLIIFFDSRDPIGSLKHLKNPEYYNI